MTDAGWVRPVPPVRPLELFAALGLGALCVIGASSARARLLAGRIVLTSPAGPLWSRTGDRLA